MVKFHLRPVQVHFAVRRPAGDTSGIRIRYTDDPMPYSAGMQLYSSYFEIPPKSESHLVTSQCCYKGFEAAHGIAFRVHTHGLGRHVPTCHRILDSPIGAHSGCSSLSFRQMQLRINPPKVLLTSTPEAAVIHLAKFHQERLLAQCGEVRRVCELFAIS